MSSPVEIFSTSSVILECDGGSQIELFVSSSVGFMIVFLSSISIKALACSLKELRSYGFE